MGSAHPLNAPYQAFEASDGWLVVGGANKKHWLLMLEALGASELASDPRFVTGADRMAHLKELEAVLSERFRTKSRSHWLAALVIAGTLPALAAWQPQKPIEFVATAGPGGGTDNLARAVQNIITKHKLTDQPIVVVNKGGGSGAEGYVYGKASAGDPYKVIFG